MPYVGPTEINVRGQDWIRDGSWFVPKALVDQYGGDVENVPPQLVEQQRISYADGVNTQTTEQRARNQGDPTGQDQFYGLKQQLGMPEFNRRWQLSNSLGVNRSTDSGPRGVLADELFYGHMDELPGMPGVYFNARSNGTYVFKDQSGNEIPPNGQLMQAAQAGVQQGYGTGAPRLNPDGSSNTGGGNPQQPPVLPPAPGGATPGNPVVKPKQDPIFTKPQIKPQAPGATQDTAPQLPPTPKTPITAQSLQSGVAQLPTTGMGGGGMQQPAPGAGTQRMVNMATPGRGASGPQAPMKMPDFSKIAGTNNIGTPGLPKPPSIGQSASSFKIG